MKAEQNLQNLHQEADQKLAAAAAEADSKLQAATADLQQRLQAFQQNAGNQLQLATTQLQQQLQAEHRDIHQQLQQQLQASQSSASQLHTEKLTLEQQLQSCRYQVENLHAEKSKFEKQVASAEAKGAGDMLELRQNFKAALTTHMGAHSAKLEETQKAHKQEFERHQQDIIELQRVLKSQGEDSLRREHQALQQHGGGMAAKDQMVQQM